MGLTLNDFFDELDRFEERIPLEVLTERLKELEIGIEDYRETRHFGERTYKRNLLREGPGYSALILCWKSGQRSPIHDHRGSTCGVRVLEGVATETLFDRTPEGWICATGSGRLGAGGVCGSQDDDIHQVSNLRPRGEPLVTLHLYSPTLLVMGTYSLTGTQRGELRDPVFALADGAGI